MSYTAEDFGSGASIWESEFDQPLPGNQAGSSIPTPPPWVFPNAPNKHPFDTPAGDGGDVDPGFGMGYGQVGLFSPMSVLDAEQAFEEQPMGLQGDDMENTYGSLGAEAWYTTLAKAAATVGAAYADKRGLIPESARQPLAQAGFLPVVETAQEAVEEVVAPARPNWIMPVAIGGGLLLVLMMMRRRR